MQRYQIKNNFQSVHLPNIHGAAFSMQTLFQVLGTWCGIKQAHSSADLRYKTNTETIKSHLFCCCKMLKHLFYFIIIYFIITVLQSQLAFHKICICMLCMCAYIYMCTYVLNPVENLSSAYFLQFLNYAPLHSQILVVCFSNQYALTHANLACEHTSVLQ